MLKLDVYVYMSHLRQTFAFLYLNISIRTLFKNMFSVLLLVDFISIESFIWIQIASNITWPLIVAAEHNGSGRSEEPYTWIPPLYPNVPSNLFNKTSFPEIWSYYCIFSFHLSAILLWHADSHHQSLLFLPPHFPSCPNWLLPWCWSSPTSTRLQWTTLIAASLHPRISLFPYNYCIYSQCRETHLSDLHNGISSGLVLTACVSFHGETAQDL